jgi:hypothetical protein
LALFAASAIVPTALAQATVVATRTAVGTGTGGYVPALQPVIDVVIVGKVVEVEPGTIELPLFKGAPKNQNVKYRVAIVKIEDPILGASGITRVRVGYHAEPPMTPGPELPPPPGLTAPVATGMALVLTPDTEGCFKLAKHPGSDFYVLTGSLTRKKDPNFAKEVEKLKKVARAMNDPVAALKAKDLDDRFEAAQIILQRYLIPQGSNKREPVPDEENTLLVALLKDLPWLPADGKRTRADGKVVPHRAALWYSINPAEFGFKRPDPPKRNPGNPPPNMDKLMDEATTKFLSENGDKIKLKRFVQK